MFFVICYRLITIFPIAFFEKKNSPSDNNGEFFYNTEECGVVRCFIW